MGSGPRFTFTRLEGFGIGFYVCRFPFALTIGFNLFLWNMQIGIGKAYDE